MKVKLDNDNKIGGNSEIKQPLKEVNNQKIAKDDGLGRNLLKVPKIPVKVLTPKPQKLLQTPEKLLKSPGPEIKRPKPISVTPLSKNR